MNKVWPITVNAFMQTIRQPIFSYLVLLSIGIQVLVTSATGYSMQTEIAEGDNKLMIDSSLATLLSYAVFMAVVCASTVLSREIDSKTVLTVVSKPVSRVSVLLGKFFGVSGAVSLGFYLACISLVLNARHGVVSTGRTPFDYVVVTYGLSALAVAFIVVLVCNFFFNFNPSATFIATVSVTFTAAFIAVGYTEKNWQIVTEFYSGLNHQIFVVMLLIWMAAMIMSALAIAASTRLSMTGAMIFCIALYFLSMITAEIFGPYAKSNFLARACLWVLPNLTYFFTLDNLTAGQIIPGSYIVSASGYAVCYIVALLFTAMALFQTREMDSRADSSTAPMLVNFYAWAMRIAAAVTVIAALAMISTVGTNLAVAAAVSLAAGLLLWLVAGGFARALLWARYLVVLLAVVQLGFSVAVFFFGFVNSLDSNIRYAVFFAGVCNAVFVAIMNFRKSTKEFFSSSAGGV